jgi:putative transposase
MVVEGALEGELDDHLGYGKHDPEGMLVCDGLKGLPDAVSAVWEKTIVQTCIVHLLRNSFKYASRRGWAQLAKDVKPVYTAASESEALDRFAEFSGKWEKRYPAIIRLWENAWPEFVPFLRFDREIRTVICTTNAIESINARLRRAVNARGHFPTEQAAMKCLYLAIMSQDPTGKGRKTLDQPVEGRPERLRHHLRRPPQRGTQVTTEEEVTPLG